jgi:hypothetical protein
MKIKQRYGGVVFEPRDTAHMVYGLISCETPTAIRELSEILGRMLDAMPLTDQQKLDIVEPYGWEIVEGGK